MPKKLLFIITQPVVGGAQKYVFDLARYFNHSGSYNVSVAIGSPADGDLFQKLAQENIKTHHLESLSREVDIIGDIKVFFEILKLFKEEQPDIVHLNSSKIGVLGSLAGFVYGLYHPKPKIVFTAHGWLFKEDLPEWKRRAAMVGEWFTAKFKDKIICVSADDFNQALKHHIAPPRKLSVIHNALADKNKLISKEKAILEISQMIGRPISSEIIMLTNLGRLYATKGLNYLIEAFHGLKMKLADKQIMLVIFGDGPERAALQLLITNYKLRESIFLVGDVADASKHLPAFNALVLSSIKEGLPYAILEAGAEGVPVVATNVGGVGEIIQNGQNGFLVESKNAQALAQALEKIIQDPSHSKKMALELKKLVNKNYNFQDMAEKTEWVYKV